MNGDFDVSQSSHAERELQALLVVLRSRGDAVLAARSARWIIEELSRTPMEFGESRDYLENLNLHTRIGFAGPIAVLYAVNVPHQAVFIRQWSLWY